MWSLVSHPIFQSSNVATVLAKLAVVTGGFMAMALIPTPTATAQAVSADSQPSPEDTINALNGVFGRHSKERSSHAKGFCAAGQFNPSSRAKDFSSTPLFAGPPMPVTARFSIGGGNPQASDKGRSVRGIGVRFHLPNKEELDLVMISAPVFFAATPKQFVEFLKVRTADPTTGQKDPEKIKAFNNANPNVMAHLNYVSQTPPPASYATTPYFSTHAFLFQSQGDQERAARWSLQPTDGFQGLTEEQEQSFPNSFLEKEMRDRLTKAPARWDLLLQVAEDGDPLTDPTALWPEERRQVKVGQLIIDRWVEAGTAHDCTGFVYDPNNLPSGIGPTDDPILAIRRPAYGVSFSRRSQ